MDFREEYKKAAEEFSPGSEALERMKTNVRGRISSQKKSLGKISRTWGAVAACAVITVSAIALAPLMKRGLPTKNAMMQDCDSAAACAESYNGASGFTAPSFAENANEPSDNGIINDNADMFHDGLSGIEPTEKECAVENQPDDMGLPEAPSASNAGVGAGRDDPATEEIDEAADEPATEENEIAEDTVAGESDDAEDPYKDENDIPDTPVTEESDEPDLPVVDETEESDCPVVEETEEESEVYLNYSFLGEDFTESAEAWISEDFSRLTVHDSFTGAHCEFALYSTEEYPPFGTDTATMLLFSGDDSRLCTVLYNDKNRIYITTTNGRYLGAFDRVSAE